MGEPEEPDPPSAEPHLRSRASARPGNAALSVQNTSNGTSPDLPWLRVRVAEALTHLPRPVQRVDVLIVDDSRMSQLHFEHCSIAGTTDVLTFEASSADQPLQVDLAVCSDVASREAARRGHSLERELLLYIVHGLLHCCGYDDHDDASFAAMHREEDRLLERIGVGRTFADGGPRGTTD